MISKDQNKQNRTLGDSEHNGIYWAADDAKKCANFLHNYQYQWGDYYSGCTMQTTWLRNYLAYYLPAVHPAMVDTSLIPEGIQGEILRMYTPEMRVAIRQLISIVSKVRLSFSCTGMAGGQDVIDEIKLGNGLLDQIVNAERLDIKAPNCLEGAVVTGKWFMKTIWSTEKGRLSGIQNDQGRAIRSGGVEISTVSIFDTFYDIEFQDAMERPWTMVRVTRNRWDLIAEHPDLSSEIRALPATNERTNYNFFLGNRKFNYDNVDVYEFYHRPSPALPKGRILIFCEPSVILHDDFNKYGCIPIEEMSPENILATGMSYPKMTDLMGTQECLDNTISAAVTNSASFAVQNVLVPRGANINVDEMNGMRWVSYTPMNQPGGGEPKALNLSKTAPETFKLIELLSSKIQNLSLLSGVLQGNPPPGVTSGTAIATLSASSIEAMSAFNLAYYTCMEKTMGHAINCYQKFADLEQIVEIESKNAQKSGRNFTRHHIKNLSGVKISNTNPLMNMISGRIEIAEKLMNMPRSQWGDYCAILEGQPLRNLYRGEVGKTNLIELENEMLSQGIEVPVLITDNHAKHIEMHSQEIADPSVRLNAEYLHTVLNHIEQHYQLSKTTPPDLQYMVETGMVPPQPQGGIPQGMGSPLAPQPQAAAIGRGPRGNQVEALKASPHKEPQGHIAGKALSGSLMGENKLAEPAQDALRRV